MSFSNIYFIPSSLDEFFPALFTYSVQRLSAVLKYFAMMTLMQSVFRWRTVTIVLAGRVAFFTL